MASVLSEPWKDLWICCTCWLEAIWAVDQWFQAGYNLLRREVLEPLLFQQEAPNPNPPKRPSQIPTSYGHCCASWSLIMQSTTIASVELKAKRSSFSNSSSTPSFLVKESKIRIPSLASHGPISRLRYTSHTVEHPAEPCVWLVASHHTLQSASMSKCAP